MLIGVSLATFVLASCLLARALMKLNPKDTAFWMDKTRPEILSETSLYMLNVIMAQCLLRKRLSIVKRTFDCCIIIIIIASERGAIIT